MIHSENGNFTIGESAEFLPDWRSVMSTALFYPGCGLDHIDVEICKSEFSIFVHADYRVKPNEIEPFYESKVCLPEYELENIFSFNRSIFLPPERICFLPDFPLKREEMQLLENVGNRNLTNSTFFLGVYKRKDAFEIEKVISPVSGELNPLKKYLFIFFFLEDIVPLYNGLYFHNQMNPYAVYLSQQLAEDPYRTVLSAPNFRFHTSLVSNALYHDIGMPTFVLTDMAPTDLNKTKDIPRHFWKEYCLKRVLDNGWITNESYQGKKVFVFEKDLLLI